LAFRQLVLGSMVGKGEEVAEVEVDGAEEKRRRKAAKRAAAAAAEEMDAAEAKKQKKAAKKAAAAAAEAAAEEAAPEEKEEIDGAEAKRQKKAAKKAAAAAAAVEEAVPEATEEIDEAEAKKQKKAAKKAAAAAAAAEEEAAPEAKGDVEDAEARKQRKAAKRAAREAAAEGRAEVQEEQKESDVQTPPTKKKKNTEETASKEKDSNGTETPKKEADDSDPNPYRLFVGGIPWSVEEDQLRKDFSECGEIVDLKLMMDMETGKSKGIAFITYSDEAGFQAALKFDGKEYAGRKLNISKANSTGGKSKGKGKGKDGKGKGKGKHKGPGPKPAGCTSVVVKGLAYEVTADDLKEVFKNCGPGPQHVKLFTDRETGASKGLAFVDFDDESAVDEAMKLTETVLKGRAFFMDYSKPRDQ